MLRLILALRVHVAYFTIILESLRVILMTFKLPHVTMILFIIMVSYRRHIFEILIPVFNKQGLATYIRAGFSASSRNDFTFNCHEIQLIKIVSQTHNFYIFNLNRSPSSKDSIYDCLMTSMSHNQELDPKSFFIFVGELNAHHQDWLNSNMTDKQTRFYQTIGVSSGTNYCC